GGGICERHCEVLVSDRRRRGKTPETSLACQARDSDLRDRVAQWYLPSSHVSTVHIEHVVDRSAHELGSSCQEQRMYAIDRLCHIRHGDLVGVSIEDVEGQAGVQGVAKSDGLAQDVSRRNL